MIDLFLSIEPLLQLLDAWLVREPNSDLVGRDGTRWGVLL